jgi:hypothetical protein
VSESLLGHPKHILRGAGCKQCNSSIWDYDKVKHFVEIGSKSGCLLLSASYKTQDELLVFECVCGNEFHTKFREFKFSNKRTCDGCGKERRDSSKRLIYDYVKGQIEHVLDKGFLLISKTYTNSQTPLQIMCPNGHVFEKRYGDFLQGSRCQHCTNEWKREIRQLPFEEVRKNIELNNGYKLLSNNYTNSKQKLAIQCPNNHQFNMTYDCFIYGSQRCPNCKTSKGEERIKTFLKSKGIPFQEQFMFDDCRHKRKLKFDFAIFADDAKSEISFIVDYDGQQHFELSEFFGGIDTYELTKLRDSIKNEYCASNNIDLIRIPYWDYDNIETILQNKIS